MRLTRGLTVLVHGHVDCENIVVRSSCSSLNQLSLQMLNTSGNKNYFSMCVVGVRFFNIHVKWRPKNIYNFNSEKTLSTVCKT